jgi:adenine-specific DNA-methyltransferase
MKLYEALEKQLKKEINFVSDNGQLKKWVVINKAQNYDADIITLLLDDKELKEKFFIDVKGILVFNQNLFVQFLEQKNYLNDSYTQYKNKVGLTIGEKYLKQRNEVALVWPFKDCILEGGQSREEDEREEIFFNETLAQDEITQLLEPKILTNAKTYDKDGKQDFKGFTRDAELNKKRDLPEDTITDNLIIKGNNLLALHTLKKEFTGKIKLIYIDPPFNTGNDSFQYNDSFNHSTWMTFMKNRLLVAKKLLKEDGLIFVHCDFNEDSYLKVLMDELFEENLYITTITVKSNSISGNKTQHKDKTILKNKDSILVYKKRAKIQLTPQYVEKTKWDTHYNSILIKEDEEIYEIKKLKDVLIEKGIIEKDYTIKSNSINNPKFYEFIFNNKESIFRGVNSIPKELEELSLKNKDKVVFVENNGEKMFAINGSRLSFLSKSFKEINGEFKMAQLLGDLWVDIDFQNTQNEGGVSLTNGKKPEALLKRIIELASNENDIILDYHFGSGTTGAVTHKLNRQYIGIEQLDYGKNDSVKRLQNVINGEPSGISKFVDWKGGGSFTYFELKKYNQTFIEQIEEAKDTKSLLIIWKQMKAKSFLNYNVDIQKQDEHIEEFKKLELVQQKKHLIELLDKNQLYVNLSSLNDKQFACTKVEKEVTQNFYQLKKD